MRSFHRLLVSFLFVSCLTKVLVLNICIFCFVKLKSAFFLTFCSVQQQYHTKSVYHFVAYINSVYEFAVYINGVYEFAVYNSIVYDFAV